MNTAYRYERSAPPLPEKKKRGFPWWTLLVIALCLGALGYVWTLIDAQLTAYDQFQALRATVSKEILFGPVYIDDVSVYGMTLEEAREAVSRPMEQKADAFEVTIAFGSDSWRISADDIPMQWDTDDLLDKAYSIGRKGSLEDRYRQITGIQEPVYLSSNFSYEKSAVRRITDQIASVLTEPAVDAAVIAFDLNTNTFQFTDERAGQIISADRLYERVIDALDSGRYGSTIDVQTEPLEPKVTRAMLEKGYTKIASYTTKTTSDENRNTNIRLAAEALNGVRIDPDGSFSFNETTGKRTEEKGYKEAGAIENGRTIQEFGGGVCQVSTTAFNALSRANCEIVQRKPHAWPSDYVPRGEDAAVDWPSLDLVMKNPTDTPMFITAWYENQSVTVEVYGLTLGDGLTIELTSETTYTKEPKEVKYTYNGDLAVGTQQLLRKPRTAYAVQTYRILLQDGEEISREKYYTSDYRMINEEYEYNDGKGPPDETDPV